MNNDKINPKKLSMHKFVKAYTCTHKILTRSVCSLKLLPPIVIDWLSYSNSAIYKTQSTKGHNLAKVHTKWHLK